MPNGIELAKAYVQVIPSTEGIQGDLEKAMGSAGEKAGEKGGKGIASGIGKVIGGIGKVAAAGLAATTAGIAGITTAATESYAEFEQLSGGVEKLYGDASNQVLEFANQAYSTAGMSANQYLETATSFSASLINSLGGDVDEAAKITDVAMRAMSDNVNVFGSDMGSVTNAFMGFSKQNYTMLDNLKLGYGGTKSEMERLIADANEYRASIGETSDLSIESFADIVKAIQSIQEAQNIAGTTGREAMTTIEGSAAATKAAWQNVLTAIGTGEGMDVAMDQLLTSIFGGEDGGGLLNNILPRVQTILTSLGEFLPTAAPVFAQAIGGLIQELLPSMLESAGVLFGGLIDGFLAVLPTVIEYLPTILETVISLILEVGRGIVGALPQLMEMIASALPTLIPQIVDGLVSLFLLIVDNFGAIIDPIIVALPDIINSLTDALIRNLPQIILGIVRLVGMIIARLPQILAGIWQTITGFFGSVWNNWIAPNREKVLGFFRGIWDGIKGAFSAVTSWFRDIFSKAWQAVKNVFSTGGRVFEGIKEGIAGVFHTVVNAIIRGINVVIAAPFNAINGIFNRLRGISILKMQPFSWLPALNVPQIPQLYEGGVLERGQMGILEGTGAEAVVPLERNTGWIKRVAAEMAVAGPDNYTDAADDIIDALHGLRIYLDGDALVGGVAGRMDQNLGGRQILAGRGVTT